MLERKDEYIGYIIVAAVIAMGSIMALRKHQANLGGSSSGSGGVFLSHKTPGAAYNPPAQPEQAQPADGPRSSASGRIESRRLRPKGSLVVPSPGTSGYTPPQLAETPLSITGETASSVAAESAPSPSTAGKPTSAAPAPAPASPEPKAKAGSGIIPGDAIKAREVLATAKKLAVAALAGGEPVGGRADPVFQGVMSQLAAENDVIAHIQERIGQENSTGQKPRRESLRRDAAAFAAASGTDSEALDLDILVERSLAPAPPADPAAVGAHTAEVFAKFVVPTPEERKEILREADKPPVTHDPPPKGAIELYNKNREAFEWARRELGVEPHHILGILGVETRFGNYTGTHPVMKTLYAIAADGGRKGKQAQRDLAGLMRLDQRGEFGKESADTMRGSYAGAIGIPQFLPSSWEAYSLDKDGGGRDPFNYSDAVISVANYLKKHGYSQSAKKSFWGYNHSSEYVEKVNNLAEQIKGGLPK